MTWFTELRGPSFGYMGYVFFLDQVERARRAGEHRIEVDFGKVKYAYPDGMAPFVASISHLTQSGMSIGVAPPSSVDQFEYWQKVGWLAGIQDEPLPPMKPGASYVPLTRYSSGEDLNIFISQALNLMASSQAFPEGVLRAFEWSLNEIADNVLVHSEADGGWLQMTTYPGKEQVEFVVVDTGRGIRRSLAEAYPDVPSDLEALHIAIQKGTTRNREIGQGNGLSGTLRIVTGANGWANLHSGTGQLRLLEGDLHDGTCASHQGVVVTMTLPTGKPIDLAEALWGHVPVPAFEMDYVGEHGIEFRLGGEATNFGNRATGQRLRHKLENLMTQHPDEPVIIDFEGVDLLSASFADEFIAKLVKDMGTVAFFGRFRFRHLTGFAAQTVDRVIEQRMSV